MTAEGLIAIIDNAINESWFGDPALGPWPDDPDGGEMRIVTALINILAECARSERLGQYTIGTPFIRTLVERVFIENEGRIHL